MNAIDVLREARRRRGWTQAQLARAGGVPQSTIARWESGRVAPRLDSLGRVLEAAGFRPRIELDDETSIDREQILERLRWSPAERLRYLTDMIAFEQRARGARIAG